MVGQLIYDGNVFTGDDVSILYKNYKFDTIILEPYVDSRIDENFNVKFLSFDIAVSGTAFTVDGVAQPDINLDKSDTTIYRFYQSDISNTEHLFQLSYSSDNIGNNTISSGVRYIGTPGTENSYTELTVIANTPDTIYYYSNTSGSMGASISIE
jgi:hypothetical protein